MLSDLSRRCFFGEPDAYDGGEHCVEDTFGVHRAKLSACDLVPYPASSLHRVTPVTRGARVASFSWIQSIVRGNADRTLLLQLDTQIQALSA